MNSKNAGNDSGCSHLARTGLGILVTVAMTTQVVADDGQKGEAVAEDEATAGVVIRLSEELFHSAQPEVDRTTAVRQTIVGVRNVGTAHTTGQIYPDFRNSRTGMSFDLTFEGVTHSRTCGRSQNVRTSSTTSTRVAVRTPITFEVTHGFVAGEALTNSHVVSACRRISPEVHGLRGLITRKVAQRRIRRLEGRIRYESASATGARIERENETKVAASVKEWNAQWEPIRQLMVQQKWFGQEPAIRTASDEHHLILYITPKPLGRDRVLPGSLADEVPPEQLPTPIADRLVEIIFYDDEVRLPVISAVVDVVDQQLRAYLGDADIADRVSIQKTEGRNWVRLSVKKNAE